MVFNVIMGIVMVVSFVGMIFCAKKQHVKPAAKPAAVGLLVLVVICAIAMLVRNMGDSEGETILQEEMQFVKSSGVITGKKIAELFPGQQVLVIAGQPIKSSERNKYFMEGLQEGFGSSAIKYVVPDVTIPKELQNPDMPEAAMGVTEYMTSKDFNKVLNDNKSCKVVLSMIGLPADPAGVKLWNDFKKHPKTCQKLILYCPGIEKMAPYIHQGLVPFIVTYKMDAISNKPISDSDQENFDTRYILVDKTNLVSMVKKYKYLFNLPK